MHGLRPSSTTAANLDGRSPAIRRRLPRREAAEQTAPKSRIGTGDDRGADEGIAPRPALTFAGAYPHRSSPACVAHDLRLRDSDLVAKRRQACRRGRGGEQSRADLGRWRPTKPFGKPEVLGRARHAAPAADQRRNQYGGRGAHAAENRVQKFGADARLRIQKHEAGGVAAAARRRARAAGRAGSPHATALRTERSTAPLAPWRERRSLDSSVRRCRCRGAQKQPYCTADWLR